MTRVFLTMIFCLLAGLPVSGESRFDQANRLFGSGDIAGAAVIYREVLSKEGPSAAGWFNLGNCEQRLGNYGPAILAYERARLLAPRDPDLLANLALARKEAAAFEEPARFPRIAGFFGFLSLNEWSWLVAGGGLFLGGLAMLCGATRLPRRWMLRSVRISAGIAALLMALGTVALYLRRDEGSRGVVLTDTATVRLSPFEKAESLGTPGPGRIVRMLESEGGFHFVEVPGTGLRGWLSDKDVSAIRPE